MFVLIICYPLVNCLVAPATCGAIADCLRILVASLLPCSRLAVASPFPHRSFAIASPPFLPAIVIITSAVATSQG